MLNIRCHRTATFVSCLNWRLQSGRQGFPAVAALAATDCGLAIKTAPPPAVANGAVQVPGDLDEATIGPKEAMAGLRTIEPVQGWLSGGFGSLRERIHRARLQQCRLR